MGVRPPRVRCQLRTCAEAAPVLLLAHLVGLVGAVPAVADAVLYAHGCNHCFVMFLEQHALPPFTFYCFPVILLPENISLLLQFF